MPTMRLQPDGTYIPDPNEHPTDLVTVRDVYGHRFRVRREHLESGRTMLPCYNQYGRRIRPHKDCAWLLHRENLQH